eukprot:gnl/Trimastix_PCT/4833.p1 GENE.gnl/Trimastix_PCT/4833~~gnl/Trimastix_PCT/4833.p1  ORF type:complete len:172 (+),score=21.50 gnl/Trimastix_PCT/4833:44-517(+)
MSVRSLCPVCGTELWNIEAVHEHIKENHPENYCDECDRTFDHVNDLNEHSQAVHHTYQGELVTYICEICHRSFGDDALLEEHLACEHSSIFCHMCRQIFADEVELSAHLGDVHGIYACCECGTEFGDLDALQQHNLAKHRGMVDPQGDYQCGSDDDQ